MLKPILCIQLELCQYNLADWIVHRNKNLKKYSVFTSPNKLLGFKSHCKSDFIYANLRRAPIRWLVDQIVSGVNYLHSENVIHRDLKVINLLKIEIVLIYLIEYLFYLIILPVL